MSAIWGRVEFDKETCSISSMDSEYKRKCKLDRIKEENFKNSLMGFGLQIINEEDENEDMPCLADNGNTIIVADCILDNREELLVKLFPENSLEKDNSSISSGKIISLAYEKWKYDFVKYIKGIFTVAIYNTAEEALFLCTDRTASRCLYYYKEGNNITFSTLISPIKMLYKSIEMNEMYMKDFLLIPGLMPNISSSETPFKNIFLIEAGCSVTITKDDVKISRYWEPHKYEISKNIDELKAQFLDVYGTAVSRVIRTNGEVGMALSGGFDSTSVAALAAPKLAKKEKKLISYTYVPYYNMNDYYERRKITNESAYVAETAKMYPNIETHFTNNDGKSFWRYLDELVDVMEIPYKAFVNLPLLLEIYRSANSRGCKVFLNGQTGNASVSYGAIDDAIWELVRKRELINAFKYFNNFCHITNIKRKTAFPKEIKKILKQINSSYKQEEFEKEDINPFVNDKLLQNYSFYERNKSGIPLNFEKKVFPKESMRYKIYTLPALAYIGAMETKIGLYTGIVIRDATRDPDILNFCLSFPFEYYSYNGVPRYLVRGFMKDVIPNCIIYPVMKTGIQSADWIYRLDSEEGIYDEIKKLLCFKNFNSYIDTNCIRDFCNQKKSFIKENEIEYMYVFIICVFVKYYLQNFAKTE